MWKNMIIKKKTRFLENFVGKMSAQCSVEIMENPSHTIWQKFRESNGFTK